MKAKVGVNLNVGYQLRGKNGKIKKLFQPNMLFSWLIKHGVISPNLIKIPFITGRWVEKMNLPNLIVTTGLAGSASRLIWDTSGHEAPFSYVGVGTGTTPTAATDTGLETELAVDGLSRALGTLSRVTTDTTNDTAQIVALYTISGPHAITESGVFNDASSGTLLARQVFSAINVVSGDSLQITWKIDLDTT